MKNARKVKILRNRVQMHVKARDWCIVRDKSQGCGHARQSVGKHRLQAHPPHTGEHDYAKLNLNKALTSLSARGFTSSAVLFCRFGIDKLRIPHQEIHRGTCISTDDANSFDDAMTRLRAGDQQGAREVFERYVQRLIALASVRLGAKLRRKVDAEDVVQSVFNSFFHRQRGDEYELTSWDGLWGLLAAITIHKCGHKIEHFQAAFRDVDDEASLPILTDESRSDWEAVARDPSPSQAAILNETIDGLMRRLDDRQREILALSLQRVENEEIAKTVKCSERTFRRTLELVRAFLLEMQNEPA